MKILFIVLGVIAAIILLLVILLHFSVKAYIEADKKHVKVLVKYLGFKLYSTEIPGEDKEDKPPDDPKESKEPDEPEIVLTEITPIDSTDDDEKAEIDKKIAEAAESPPTEEKSENSEDSGASQENSDDVKSDEEEKEPKPTLMEQWNEFKQYIPAGKKAFRKLLKLIRIRDLRFELTVGNDDPYKAGENFGNINTAVYSILGLLCCIFSVTIDHTEINCDFENKRIDFFVKTAIVIRPSAVIALAAYLGLWYLKIRKSMKKLDKLAKEKVS